MASMQRLPTEILRQIVDYINQSYIPDETFRPNHHRVLANLRRTCKILADVAADPLFSTVSTNFGSG